MELEEKLTRAFQTQLGTFKSELFGAMIDDTELPLIFLTLGHIVPWFYKKLPTDLEDAR